jgi:hypothetical protein
MRPCILESVSRWRARKPRCLAENFYRTLLPLPFMLNLTGWQNSDREVSLLGISGLDDLSENTILIRADFTRYEFA